MPSYAILKINVSVKELVSRAVDCNLNAHTSHQKFTLLLI